MPLFSICWQVSDGNGCQESFCEGACPQCYAHLTPINCIRDSFFLCIATFFDSCIVQVFGKSAEDLGMHVVYDVSHNIAKEEEHVVKGKKHRVLVHRKGQKQFAFPQ
jgi:hypothetical protein